jgi:ligand-binding sensor domain-containing protein
MAFYHWVLFLFMFTPLGVFAQTLPSKNYTTRDGLPSNQINALFQDSHGYLWIGTNNGLSVFDGISFTNYSAAHGLTNSWVTSIAESRVNPGEMWVGTIAGGVYRFHNIRFIPVETGENDRSKVISDLLEDSRGTLWSTTVDGIYAYENGVSRYVLPRQINRYSINLIETQKGLVLAGQGNSLTLLSGQEPGFKRVELSSDRNTDVTAMASSSDGRLLVGTSDSLLHVISGTHIVYSYKLDTGIARSIAVDDRGNFWISTAGAVVRMYMDEDQKMDTYSYSIDDLIPASDWAGPVLVDREDNLWVGTWTNGLIKITEKYSYKFPLTLVNTSHASWMDHLWVNSGQGIMELFLNPDGKWQKFIHQPGGSYASANLVSTIDEFGRLWLMNSDNNELSAYEMEYKSGFPSRLTHVLSLKPEVHFSNPVLSMAVDSHNRLWLGSTVVEVIDLNTLEHLQTYTRTDGLPGESVRVIYQDREQRVWVGDFDQGLAVIHASEALLQNRFEMFTTQHGLPDNRIRAIKQDRDGQIWIGTRYGGLSKYANGSFTTISIIDGLRSNSIWKIFDDNQGRLWLLTDSGIEGIDRKTLHVLPHKQILGDRPVLAGFFSASYLFVGSPNNLVIYESGREFPNKADPLIYITDVEVNGLVQANRTALNLHYSRNNVAIHFTGISLRDEKELQYQYRLVGLDTAWKSVYSQRVITYAALRPGSYTFEVKAVNTDGVESLNPATLYFSIAYPYWQTWWFIVLATGTGIFILWVIYMFRIRKVLEMERMRVRIAADLHDDVGTNLSSILIISQIMQRQAAYSDQVRENLTEISSITVSTQGMLRDIVWMLNPNNDTLDDMMLKMKELAGRLLQDMHYKFHAPQGQLKTRVSIEFKRNVFLIFKEALNNIVRHASATEVEIVVWQTDGQFKLKIADNGKGFDRDTTSSGNGFASFQRRAGQIKANFNIESAPGQGTVINLTLKNHPNA